MDPIENPWAILMRNSLQESIYPTSKGELFRKLSHVRDSMPSEYFENLIASMPRIGLELSQVSGLLTEHLKFD